MVKVSGAVIIELLGNRGDPVRFTCDNTNPSITKGDLLFLIDPRKVSGANLATGASAGIASADKESGDGATSVAVWTNGIFDIVTGEAGLGVGTLARISGGNYVVAATAAQLLSGMVLCKTLEAGDANEYIACRLGSLV